MNAHAHDGQTSRMDRMVLGVIVANAVVLVAGLFVDGYEQAFDTIHDTIIALFVLELLARLSREHRKCAGKAKVRIRVVDYSCRETVIGRTLITCTAGHATARPLTTNLRRSP
jgi:hypothetical protein